MCSIGLVAILFLSPCCEGSKARNSCLWSFRSVHPEFLNAASRDGKFTVRHDISRRRGKRGPLGLDVATTVYHVKSVNHRWEPPRHFLWIGMTAYTNVLAFTTLCMPSLSRNNEELSVHFAKSTKSVDSSSHLYSCRSLCSAEPRNVHSIVNYSRIPDSASKRIPRHLLHFWRLLFTKCIFPFYSWTIHRNYGFSQGRNAISQKISGFNVHRTNFCTRSY